MHAPRCSNIAAVVALCLLVTGTAFATTSQHVYSYAFQFPDSSFECIALDSGGNLVMPSVGTLPSTASISRYSPSGVLLQRWGSSHLSAAFGVACDDSDNVYAVDGSAFHIVSVLRT